MILQEASQETDNISADNEGPMCPVVQAWYSWSSHIPVQQLISGFSEKLEKIT